MVPPLILVGILLVAVGFIVVTMALILEFLRSIKKGEAEVEKHGGAVVMVGPLPIILASDPKTAKVLLTLAIILTIILVALTIFSYGLTSFE